MQTHFCCIFSKTAFWALQWSWQQKSSKAVWLHKNILLCSQHLDFASLGVLQVADTLNIFPDMNFAF